MRVSLRWLSEYIDLPTSDPDELAAVFGALGHEVEGVEHHNLEFSGVVVGKVEKIEPHPQADKVRVCMVSTGGDPIQVVCGAWNFEPGAVVAYATAGAQLAGGLQIGVRDIRGVESTGMICSEGELALGDDRSGIMVLDPDTPIGADFANQVELPDVVFDLSIGANRPDVMSMIGVARELSAYYQVPVQHPSTEVTEVGPPTNVDVEVRDRVGCNRFVARELTDVEVGPSPLWLRRRLRVAGVRPVSNVVDITNYVMLEIGQPLHAFDLDKVNEEKIVVRRAHPGERLRTLDGVERELAPEDLVVADAEVASGLAGTMGGGDSEVSDSTNRVLLEAANWDPPTILLMSKWHGIRTEASSRFERGVDPNLPPTAVGRAARLMSDLAGAVVRERVIDKMPHPRLAWMVKLTSSEVERILGPGFPAAYCADLLRRLHLSVESEAPLLVTVPTFRPDLTRPIDLIEEIARLHGYDLLGERVTAGRGGGFTTEQKRTRTIRQVLTGAGLSQAMTLSFSALEDLDHMGYGPDHPARNVITLRNPLRAEDAHLRTSLLPGLLRTVRYNLAHGHSNVALFEVGKVFFHRPSPEDERIPDQPERLAWVVVGDFGDNTITRRGEPSDYATSLGLCQLLAKRLHLEDLSFDPTTESGYHPGRTATVSVGGTALGFVGELHPLTAVAYELEGRVAVGELELAPLVENTPWWQFKDPSPFPPVVFDLAFAVPDAMSASELVAAVLAGGLGLLEAIRIFDEFQLDRGGRSLAMRVTLRAADRTLTNEEAATIRQNMIEASARLGAKLRGAT